jgi:hypothetical protein
MDNNWSLMAGVPKHHAIRVLDWLGRQLPKTSTQSVSVCDVQAMCDVSVASIWSLVTMDPHCRYDVSNEGDGAQITRRPNRAADGNPVESAAMKADRDDIPARNRPFPKAYAKKPRQGPLMDPPVPVFKSRFDLDTSKLPVPRAMVGRQYHAPERGTGTFEAPGVLTETTGDALSQTGTLAHCIAEDKNMGKGFALLVQNLYGKPLGRAGVGAVLRQFTRDGTVYHLVTKARSKSLPNHKDFERSLSYLARMMTYDGLNHVNMPRIGTGLDQLQWDWVKQQIITHLINKGISVTVWALPERQSSKASRKPDSVATANTAAGSPSRTAEWTNTTAHPPA